MIVQAGADPPPRGVSGGQTQTTAAQQSQTAAGASQTQASAVAPTRVGRLATTERALLAAWDLIWTVALLTVTGAFGAGAAAVLSRVAIGVLALAAIHTAGADRRTAWLREHALQTLSQLLLASTIAAWSSVLVTLVLRLPVHLAPLAITWLAAPVAWYLGRRIARLARRAAPERILIVGSGAVARRVAELARRQGGASEVVGLLDDDPTGPATADRTRPATADRTRPATANREEHSAAGDPPLLGPIALLPELLSTGTIDRVVVAFSSRGDLETVNALRSCTRYDGTVDIVPRLYDFLGANVRTYSTDGLTLMSVPARHTGRAQALARRAIDLVGASLLVVVLSPVLALIWVAIRCDSGPPVVFRQRRIGRHGHPFWILKFRTLSPAVQEREPSALVLAPDAIAQHVEQAKQDAARRATRVGSWLRQTSLDELPQLFNVLAGDMSLVGPRPLSALEDATLEGWSVLRREVRPGITGLWQVSGRSEVSWQERINLDYAQVRHWSLAGDLRVLMDTVRAVARRRGAE